jgi:ABC-type Fe3+/spermidine/putrescine transport system ATPase subunit
LHFIEIHHLDYKAQDFSLFCSKGQISFNKILVLSGISGSGKSTLLKILLGFDSGGPHFSWSLNGQRMSDLSASEKRIGMVFQDYALFPHLTCLENIQYPKGVTVEEAHLLVEKFGLQNCIYRKAVQLSGGEKQRTALARAIAYKPRVLFLDEPFSALDDETRQLCRDYFYRWVGESGLPTLLVTHDQQDYESQEVSKILIHQGQVKITEES